MGISPGPGAVVVDSPIGRLGGVICFDLNFEWLRFQYRQMSPDILCFSSFLPWWHDAGGLGLRVPRLLRLGAPRHRLCRPGSARVARSPVTHSYSKVAKARVKPRPGHHPSRTSTWGSSPRSSAATAARSTIQIPPHLGSAILYSECPRRTALDIAEEFKLELLGPLFRAVIEAKRRTAATIEPT